MSLITKERLSEDLKGYAEAFGSIRSLARATSINHETLRGILNGTRPLEIGDVIAILTACKVNPAQYFAQLLSEADRKEIAAEDEDIRMLRAGLRNRRTRGAVESAVNFVREILGGGTAPKTPPRKHK